MTKYIFFFGICNPKRETNLLAANPQIISESNPIYTLPHKKKFTTKNGTPKNHPQTQRGRERDARANPGPRQRRYPLPLTKNLGKTTIVKKFKGSDINTISPTLGFNIDT